MIDTHCHLDKAAFETDRGEVLARARAAGVTDVVVPAIGPEGWDALAALAAASPGVHFGLGVHPQLLPELDAAGDGAREAALEAALARGGVRLVGVGECGLDGGSAEPGAGPHPAPMSRQVEVLRGQLRLARRRGLPVMLHCLKAHDPMLALLAEEPLPAGGVLHSYSGSADQVKAYLRFGLHFGLAGPITYEKARKPVLAARAIPRDRLLLETDAPDQTPRPHHGRNEPALLAAVAAGVAGALGLTLEELDALTSANARALFRL